jgi:hypothetical protein
MSASYTLPSDIYTVSLWVKFDLTDTDGAYLFDNRDGSNAGGIGLYSDHSSGNRRFQLFHSEEGILDTAFDLTMGIWTHITLVKNSATFTLYKDGVFYDSDGGNDDSSNGATLVFGARNSIANFLKGNICQFGIWSAALTQAQIQSVMEKTFEELIASEKTNLVSYWALDEVLAGDTVVEDKVDDSLGSELITVEADRTFASDTSFWSRESGCAISDGTMVFTNVGGNAGFSRGSFLTSGTTYKVTVDCTSYTDGSLHIHGGPIVNFPDNTSTGTKTLYFTATSTTFQLRTGIANADFAIDNLSIKPVNGNYGALI